MNLLQFTHKGIYCKRADVYIDPLKPVDKALISHCHSDHARSGHGHYLCSKTSLPILKLRLGNHIRARGISFGETVMINGVRFSFHPAGHIIGSAQIKVEHKGEIWVVSGDYKIEDDGISEPFELIKCHHFITETTFGLPVYKWPSQKAVFDEINAWWKANKEKGQVSILTAYALGKAQRIIQNLDPEVGKIYTHGAIENVNNTYRQNGIPIKPTLYLSTDPKADDFEGALVIAPPSAIGTSWMKRFKSYSWGIASGWMAIRGMRRRRGADRGFILSDHCDWNALNKVIADSGAQSIYPTHGYTHIFSKWLEAQGYQTKVVETAIEADPLDSNTKPEE